MARDRAKQDKVFNGTPLVPSLEAKYASKVCKLTKVLMGGAAGGTGGVSEGEVKVINEALQKLSMSRSIGITYRYRDNSDYQ